MNGRGTGVGTVISNFSVFTTQEINYQFVKLVSSFIAIEKPLAIESN